MPTTDILNALRIICERHTYTHKIIKKTRSFALVPPQYVMFPQIQSTCRSMVNNYVMIEHEQPGVANNMHPIKWGREKEKNRKKLEI